MATSIVHRGMVASGSPVAMCASSSTTTPVATESRHAGAVPVFSSRDKRSWRVSQSASLSSSSHLSPSSRVFVQCCSVKKYQRCGRQHATICMVLPSGNTVADGQATRPHGKSFMERNHGELDAIVKIKLRGRLSCMKIVNRRNPSAAKDESYFGLPLLSKPNRCQRWSARAIKSFSMSELEARKMKYPTTGTESLLMGILTEGTSHASRFLRASGVSLFRVREETVKILGKADMYFFSPEHPPLTDQAQKALDLAITESAKEGGNDEVTTSYMLFGIWSQEGSAGQKVLKALGIDNQKMEDLLASEKKPVAV